MLLSATHNFLSLFLQAAPTSGQTPPSPSSEHMVAVFIAEVAVMLFLGRLLGEGMQRIGQPAVMGQLIAGILIGPSVLGTLWPHGYLQLFPDNAAQKKMIDAISQLGILMLLLLTGMETDLSLVNRMRRTALFASISGILFPFACGFLVGEYMPESLLPNPQLRLATSLFVATALSISSVKIVAMVIMEVGFLRRNVGQIILASAILDDTIGWIVIAIIGGIASGGGVNLRATSIAFLGTIAFLAVCFTLGRKVVAYIIRWTNDNLTIEMPVISAILILMFVAALVTNYIGVHTVLGAFVVGIMVGQSPILTKHIEEELRGLIVALFAPVFFAVAGREIDLTIMKSFYLIKLALVFILIASFGKVVGCYLGGRLGRLSSRESTALAIGMNARGSTEVIVATIGLSLGVLSRDLFTLIVVMAIATTLVTPPLLRWALRRIPATGEEKERLEREEAQAKEFVPKIERLLITVDDSADGQLASTLAGLFAGTRQVMTTVLELGRAKQASTLLPTDKSGDLVKASAEQGARSTQTSNASGAAAATAPALLVNHIPLADAATAIKREMEKGYDMLFVGVARTLESKEGRGGGYATSIAEVIREFKGASAVAVSKGDRPTETLKQTLNILVPTTGTDYSRRAAEVAVALAKASGGTLTALHVSPPPDVVELIRRPRELLQSGRALVREVEALGKREGVKVVPLVKARPVPEAAILRRIRRGRHNLLVLGVKVRPGEKLFFGRRTAALLENAPCSLLIVIS